MDQSTNEESVIKNASSRSPNSMSLTKCGSADHSSVSPTASTVATTELKKLYYEPPAPQIAPICAVSSQPATASIVAAGMVPAQFALTSQANNEPSMQQSEFVDSNMPFYMDDDADFFRPASNMPLLFEHAEKSSSCRNTGPVVDTVMRGDEEHSNKFNHLPKDNESPPTNTNCYSSLNALSSSFNSLKTFSMSKYMECGNFDNFFNTGKKKDESKSSNPFKMDTNAYHATIAAKGKQKYVFNIDECGGESRSQSLPGMEQVELPPPEKTKKCHICQKKLGLIALQCKCQLYFCNSHRHAEDHNCTFDYKAENQRELSEKNKAIVPDKFKK